MSDDVNVNTKKIAVKIPNTYDKAFPPGTPQRERRQEYMKIYMRKRRNKLKKQPEFGAILEVK